MTQRARIVLVGTGRMGDIRAKLMYSNPKIDLCGIVDINTEAASAMASLYQARPFNSLKEAIDCFGTNGTTPEKDALAIDGIVVCTPTFTHEAVIKEAAEHGIHIFTEKPVDETAEKVGKLFEVCEKNGAKLCCGFQRRFDESYKSVADTVRSNKIGKPVSASIFFADHPCPPIEFLLTGGDIFMDLSAHDVDFIRYALDDDVISVYATGSSSDERLQKAGVHDNACMVMTFKKGTVVTLTMSRSASYGYDQRCEIFGTEGLLCVGNEHANCTVMSDKSGIHQSRLKHSFPERFNAAFGAELEAFAETILNNSTWPITREDCIATQKVADAGRRSSSTKEVVFL